MKSVGRELALFAFFVIASGWTLRPLPLHLADRMPAGSDPAHHLYILDWLLDHGLSSDRFQGRMFHPAPYAVLRSDLSIGTVVLMAPLAPFIDEPLIRFNLATWLALAFSGWAFCLLARSWTGSTAAGVLAGVTAVLGSHQALHYVHLNLLSVGFLPIFLLALDRTLSKPSPFFTALTAVSFALNAASSGYYGVTAVVVGVVMFARAPSKDGFLRCVSAAAVALLLLSPYLLAYADLHQTEGLERTSLELQKGSFTPNDLGSKTLLHRAWNPAIGEPLFPGVVVTALAAYGLLRGGRRERTLGLAAALLFWLGFGEPGLLYRAVAFAPPFSSMRHPVTLSAVAVMLLSVLAAAGWSSLVSRSRRTLAVSLALVAGVETMPPRVALVDVEPDVPQVYAAMLARPEGPVLEVPPYGAPPLIWAARRGFETVNGGGAFIPAITTRIETTTQNHWLTDSYQPVDESKAAAILLNETATRYVILPAGRSGGYVPLIQRFRESRCFLEIGVYEGDVLFETVRESVCPAFVPGGSS